MKSVAWSTGRLRPHPAFDQLGWRDIEDLNRAVECDSQSIRDHLRVTKQGIILSGVGEWQLATIEEKQYVNCLEYDLDSNQALEFILAHSGPRKGLNDFIRICLALTLEEYLRGKGRENMSAAGKRKGLTTLSNLTPIDVRRLTADLAGTGTGNVDKVRMILEKAHPNIIRALQEGSLRIHRGWTWCRLSPTNQLELFREFEEGLAIRKTARSIEKRGSHLLITAQEVFKALESLENLHPGQVRIGRTERRKTVILLGSDLVNEIQNQRRFDGFN
jgi:hypothetical protein